ncbi:MAG: hypothetical protein M9958_03315 [Chitinophagales bacterium]|nr:hypothetical protein [Chitinophagales bacterium]
MRPLAKMDVVRCLEAYLKEFEMTEELEQSIFQTLTLLRKSVVMDAESVILGLTDLSNIR